MPTISTRSLGSVSVRMRFSVAVKLVFPDADPPAIPTTILPVRAPDISEYILHSWFDEFFHANITRRRKTVLLLPCMSYYKERCSRLDVSVPLLPKRTNRRYDGMR